MTGVATDSVPQGGVNASEAESHHFRHIQCLLSSDTQVEMGMGGSGGQGDPNQAVIGVMPFRGSLPEKV